MMESRHKIGSFKLPHCFSCFVSLLYRHSVTSLSVEQCDMRLASESQAGISILHQPLLRFPRSAAFIASSCSFLVVKWEWLLHRLTRTTSTSRTLVNGGGTAGLDETNKGMRWQEGGRGRCQGGKLTTCLGFALLRDYTRNTFFLS